MLMAIIYANFKAGKIFNMVKDEEKLPLNIEELRAEALEDGDIEESAVLLLLLKQSRCLKFYFSKFEQPIVNSRLKQFESSPDYRIFATVSRTILMLDLLTWS